MSDKRDVRQRVEYIFWSRSRFRRLGNHRRRPVISFGENALQNLNVMARWWDAVARQETRSQVDQWTICVSIMFHWRCPCPHELYKDARNVSQDEGLNLTRNNGKTHVKFILLTSHNRHNQHSEQIWLFPAVEEDDSCWMWGGVCELILSHQVDEEVVVAALGRPIFWRTSHRKIVNGEPEFEAGG